MKHSNSRRLGLATALLGLVLAGAAVAAAGQPQGLKGYEGQPGNQGGQGGQQGYEGQPGNQSGQGGR